jgi:hypothetical protein
MTLEGPMLQSRPRVALVTADNEDREPEIRTRATRDHTLIQRWAARRQAEPATGETTSSGPAVNFAVNDRDAGVRFNFPGFARYRPIPWAEWFDNFERNNLIFVFERDEPGRPLANRCRLIPTAALDEEAIVV